MLILSELCIVLSLLVSFYSKLLPFKAIITSISHEIVEWVSSKIPCWSQLAQPQPETALLLLIITWTIVVLGVLSIRLLSRGIPLPLLQLIEPISSGTDLILQVSLDLTQATPNSNPHQALQTALLRISLLLLIRKALQVVALGGVCMQEWGLWAWLG